MNPANYGMLNLTDQEQLGQLSVMQMALDFGTTLQMIHLGRGATFEKWISMIRTIEHQRCCHLQMNMKLILARMYLFWPMALVSHHFLIVNQACETKIRFFNFRGTPFYRCAWAKLHNACCWTRIWMDFCQWRPKGLQSQRVGYFLCIDSTSNHLKCIFIVLPTPITFMTTLFIFVQAKQFSLASPLATNLTLDSLSSIFIPSRLSIFFVLMMEISWSLSCMGSFSFWTRQSRTFMTINAANRGNGVIVAAATGTMAEMEEKEHVSFLLIAKRVVGKHVI